MDTAALFLTFFLFFIQMLAQGAAMKWPEHRYLANCIFWASLVGAVASFIWYLYSNLGWLITQADMIGRQKLGIALAIICAAGLVAALSLIASGDRPRTSEAFDTSPFDKLSQDESERRYDLIYKFGQDYRREQGQTGFQLFGFDPPAEYTNKRLEQLGEKWRVDPNAPRPAPKIENNAFVNMGPNASINLDHTQDSSFKNNLVHGHNTNFSARGAQRATIEGNRFVATGQTPTQSYPLNERQTRLFVEEIAKLRPEFPMAIVLATQDADAQRLRITLATLLRQVGISTIDRTVLDVPVSGFLVSTQQVTEPSGLAMKVQKIVKDMGFSGDFISLRPNPDKGELLLFVGAQPF